MIKNTLKKSLALGLLMTFLITGSVWAADEITEDENTKSIIIGSSVDRPSSAGGGSGGVTASSVVAMGRDINYADGNENLVLLGKDIDADGKRLVYIGSNINKSPTGDEIKTYIANYIANLNNTNSDTDTNQVAIGSLINITGKNSVAIGMGVTVEANNAVAIGSGSAATENNTVSFGRDKITIDNITIDAINRRLTHVDDGINATDAVNKGQLDAETIRAQNVEHQLATAITNEISRAQNVEHQLPLPSLMRFPELKMLSIS